jgi:hypothetical protein
MALMAWSSLTVILDLLADVLSKSILVVFGKVNA